MSSPASFGSRMLFQSINDDLNASMATADELSREFNSLLKEASTPSPTSTPSNNNTAKSGPKVSSPLQPMDSISYSIKTTTTPTPTPTPTVFTTSPLSSPRTSTVPRTGSESFTYTQPSPKQSPNTLRRHSPGQTSPRHVSPNRYDRSPRGSTSYPDRSPLSSPTVVPLDPVSRSAALHSSSNRLSPFDSNTIGRRSPLMDRGPSPLSLNHPVSATLPRSFVVRQPDEGVQHQKSPSKWNETDLDKSYERKPHHTYDKTEWLRPSVPNSSWRESNLDGPPPAPSSKKDPRSPSFPYQSGSLQRNTRITVPPDVSSPAHSPYYSQPIISRISIPPASSETRKRKPIPLSVIMRLQNPHWRAMTAKQAKVMGGELEMSSYQPAGHVPREKYAQLVFPPQQPQQQQQPQQPESRQSTIYTDVLNPGDIDAELEKLDYIYHIPVIQENPNAIDVEQPAPRPLSPTRLQPVVAPEAQIQVIPDVEELLRIREEIPRPLKKRGSVDKSQPLKSASHYQPNQYKNLIDKLFRRKGHGQRGEHGSETSSSSDGEECAVPPPRVPQTSTLFPHDFRNYHSILRRSNKERKGTGNRARLSPLVLLLDGALVGELETVQRAVQEMSDPSQPNDEGITALHNAVCGGHYNVVDFLVRVGANVSSPDSHGWTPLHCAASCNDRPLCEFLVRNGAAIMAMTESDGAIASQKCDPYAFAFEECESYLRGVEEAMGVENSGVLYALWSYPAQGPDELNFREGDMVTILQKPEGSSWWWASLYGREGLVPNNYFGLFPKVRPKTLC